MEFVVKITIRFPFETIADISAATDALEEIQQSLAQSDAQAEIVFGEPTASEPPAAA